MKHKFEDDVNIKLKVDFSEEKCENLVDKVVEGAVTIIVVATAAHILRRWLT